MVIKEKRATPTSVGDSGRLKARESQDVKSSVGAAPKKNGQGGNWTWDGSDVTAGADFTPNPDKIQPTVQVLDSPFNSPSQSGIASDEEGKGFRLSEADFPALGASVKTLEKQANKDTWIQNVQADRDFDL